jgi:hypothetical protein
MPVAADPGGQGGRVSHRVAGDQVDDLDGLLALLRDCAADLRDLGRADKVDPGRCQCRLDGAAGPAAVARAHGRDAGDSGPGQLLRLLVKRRHVAFDGHQVVRLAGEDDLRSVVLGVQGVDRGDGAVQAGERLQQFAQPYCRSGFLLTACRLVEGATPRLLHGWEPARHHAGPSVAPCSASMPSCAYSTESRLGGAVPALVCSESQLMTGLDMTRAPARDIYGCDRQFPAATMTVATMTAKVLFGPSWPGEVGVDRTWIMALRPGRGLKDSGMPPSGEMPTVSSRSAPGA